MPVPIEEHDEFFQHHFYELIKRYRIYQDGNSIQNIEAQRVGYLCSIIIMKMYDHRLGPDAYTWFYNWAYEKKIHCSKIGDETYDKHGRFVFGPWPTSPKRFYEHLSFAKYTDIADRILFPEREPLCKREPLVCLSNP